MVWRGGLLGRRGALVWLWAACGALCQLRGVEALLGAAGGRSRLSVRARASGQDAEEYSNPLTAALGRFLPPPQSSLDTSDWSIRPKRRKTSLASLAKDLKVALTEREWFVSGDVDPKYFSRDFQFSDPDVSLIGIEKYAAGVNKLFDQNVTRGQIISVEVRSDVPNTITVTWRLEGRVNIGLGLKIKAFVCYSDLTVDSQGLISYQQDRFSIPGYDILLSAIGLGWLPGLAPAAPPI